MRAKGWLVAFLLVALALALTACGTGTAGSGEEDEEETHAKVEPIPGSDVKKVVLTEAAFKSLGVQTTRVRSFREDDGGHALVVPYAAVLYDSEGRAFTYTNPARLTYVRKRVVIDDIHKRKAYLAKGPPVGTAVVTVGADELLGVEEGVQE